MAEKASYGLLRFAALARSQLARHQGVHRNYGPSLLSSESRIFPTVSDYNSIGRQLLSPLSIESRSACAQSSANLNCPHRTHRRLICPSTTSNQQFLSPLNRLSFVSKEVQFQCPAEFSSSSQFSGSKVGDVTKSVLGEHKVADACSIIEGQMERLECPEDLSIGEGNDDRVIGDNGGVEPDGKPSSRHDLAILFTCVVCDTRSAKTMSRATYETGVVIVRCPGCKNLHLIADRKGWFGEPGSVETFLASKGVEVRKGTGETYEFTTEDLTGWSTK